MTEVSAGVPFRLAVVETLVAGIAAAVPTLAKTHYGVAVFGESDALPLASVIEDPREQPLGDAPQPATGHGVPWRLLLQGFVEDDEVNPTRPAYILAAQLMVAVSTVLSAGEDALDPGRKKNRIMGHKIGAPIVRPPDEFSSKAYCWIPITLDLFETPSQPFT